MTAAYDGVVGNIVFLPLSHDLLLIGAQTDSDRLLPLYKINQSSAELSLHFFVSSCSSEKEEGYHLLIGRNVVRAPKVLD